MGKVEVTLPPEVERKKLLSFLPKFTEEFSIAVRSFLEDREFSLDRVSPVLQEEYKGHISLLRQLEELLQDMKLDYKEETPLETLRHDYEFLREYAEKIDKAFSADPSEEVKLSEIVEDPKTGERKVLEFKTQKSPDSPALQELKKLSSLRPLEKISISKDLVSSEFSSQGDILEIGTEEEKRTLRDLRKKGKLLFGSMEGLSGGTAFFKSVSIVLAKLLNEQSQYYNPEGKGDKKGTHRLSGVPKDRIKEIFGENAKLQKSLNSTPVRLNGEDRNFTYIFLPYERGAKEVSKTGKISGGKDIENFRLYVNGGYREFTTDPKTGDKKPVPSSYTPGISSKKYPVSNGRGGFIFLPFVVNEAEVVDSTRKDPEVGCLLRLSPLYSKTLRGYSSLRSDTIQLIGGAKQKEITMDLISFLVFSRNTTPVLRKLKSDILSKYKDRPTYRGRPGKLETHFKEAVQKSKDARIIQDYKEEKTSGGEIVSVFVYNPDYLKGEEISLPEEQGGEE